MKKIAVIMLVMMLCVSFYGCKKDVSKETSLTIDISEGITDEGRNFFYSCDLDYDGINEFISMSVENVQEEYDYEQYITLQVGTHSTKLELFDGCIEKVYSCDIDKDDKMRDIAIITVEGSGDPRIRILSYKNGLIAYRFSYDGENGKEVSDSNWLGYACSFYFDVVDDKSIKLEEQTNSHGMWSVYREYKLNKRGIFEENSTQSYRVLPDYMENRAPFSENAEKEEIEKWKSGYIMAHCNYANESIYLKEGDYFKPLYDDDNNKLYIETEDGRKGYINTEYEKFKEREELNDAFFFLAG